MFWMFFFLFLVTSLLLRLCRCLYTKRGQLEHLALRGTYLKWWTVWDAGVILLPVNDDRVRGRLVSVAATFLLTTAAEWAS